MAGVRRDASAGVSRPAFARIIYSPLRCPSGPKGLKMASEEQFILRVLDGCAAPSEKSKRFKAKLETQYEDAGYKDDPEKGEMTFVFAEGLVVFKERAVTADDAAALLEKVTELEQADSGKLMESYLGEPPKQTFCFRIIVGDEKLMSVINDKMWIAKLLFQETGSLGAAEMGMLETSLLDFGENAWVVSPVGVLLAGEIEDIRRCIYLVSQSMVGVATYLAIANELKQQLYETPPTFTESELSTYEGKLENLSDTTSYLINDVRDEMLNADPRTVLIVRKLQEVMSIVGHEERVRVFLDVARRKVERARSVKAGRESKRLSAILFAFSMIIAISNSLVIYINLTRNMSLSPMQAILVEMPLLVLTVALVIYLFREIFKRTLQF